jgi:hypothetical protein
MNIEIRILQEKRGIFIQLTPCPRIVKKVVMKLTPDRVEEAPSSIIPPTNKVVPGFEDISAPPVEVE